MRIAFCADVHVGNHRRHGGPVSSGLNLRCRAVIASLRDAMTRVAALDIPMVVLGDLVDSSRVEPQILAEIQRVCLGVWEGEPKLTFLLGNHDQNSTDPGDHALGVLSSVAHIVESPAIVRVGPGVELALVPHMPGDPTVRPDVVFPRRDHKVKRVMGIHRGIADASTPPYLRGLNYNEASAWAGSHGADAVFAGDWHERRSWTFNDTETPPGWRGFPSVHQCGALVPTGWDNPGFGSYGKVLVYDTDSREIETLDIPGPRFVKARTMAEIKSATSRAEQEGSSLYLQVIATPTEAGSATALVEQIRERGQCVACEVETENPGALAAARAAAEVARSGSSLEESLAGFVSEMTLEPGVDRGAVLARSRSLLGLSAQGA